MGKRKDDDEEVVELNMPRPRSISRRPMSRKAEASSPSGDRSSNATTSKMKNAEETPSSHLKEGEESHHSTTTFKPKVLRSDTEPQSRTEKGDEQEEASTVKHSGESDVESSQVQDSDFRSRMAAIDPADIAEVQEYIRTDPDYTIQHMAPEVISQAAMVEQGNTAERTDTEEGLKSEEASLTNAPRDTNDTLAPQNPTHDHQYAVHHGSRGISPPPGFEDTAVPSYQDLSDAPAYHNIMSAPPGIPVVANRNAESDVLPESERPAMTDKFMNAHIARHGASSLSPLALLTPDQADILPEYVLTGVQFPDQSDVRGRARDARSLTNSPAGRERSKALEAMEAVRSMEEREALDAIQAMEAAGNDRGSFNPDQLAAMIAVGDLPENYFSPAEVAQYQRLASDSSGENLEQELGEQEERQLLQMLAQYGQRPPPGRQDDEQGDDENDLEEIANMLRDRILTQSGRTRDSSGAALSETEIQQLFARNAQTMEDNGLQAAQVDPVILTILQNAAQVQDAAPVTVDDRPLTDAEAAKSTNQQDVESAEQQQQQTAGYGGGHGVKKTILDPEAYAALQVRNAQKAEAYTALAAQVNTARQAGDRSREAFDLTTKLLMLNPEYYSIWNYRREIMLEGLFPHLDQSETEKLLDEELKRLQGIMREYPKVYWIWNHRKWCLAQCPWPDWARELLLVSKMLEVDARNFHVWEYRRYVVSQSEKLEETSKAAREFEYTTAAIHSNFSNFSAWHNRTKLIPQMLNQIEDVAERDTRRQEMLQEELELIKGAIYTDPDDQSVWLYHRWLLNPDSASLALHPLAPSSKSEHIDRLSGELQMVEELMEEEPENAWCTYAKCHYNLSLQRLLEREDKVADLRGLMDQLEESDALRRGRYRDWKSTHFAIPSEPSAVLFPINADGSGKKEEEEEEEEGFEALAVKFFTLLKKRGEWRDVTLDDRDTITALHLPTGQRMTILPHWKLLRRSLSVAKHPLVVADQQGGSADLVFYRIEPL